MPAVPRRERHYELCGCDRAAVPHRQKRDGADAAPGHVSALRPGRRARTPAQRVRPVPAEDGVRTMSWKQCRKTNPEMAGPARRRRQLVSRFWLEDGKGHDPAALCRAEGTVSATFSG